jgi:hypothetical protein
MPITDLLAQLFELKWRDVAVPVMDFDTELEHDQVAHEWPDRDGAHVEATGRRPLIHRATIPFYSNISPGPVETWNSGNTVLYPTVFRDFLIAFSIRRSGPLQHPELGIITCKPKTCHFQWRAQRRDGCLATATWIESDDDGTTDFRDVLLGQSPVPAAQVAAEDLDTLLAAYNNDSLEDPNEPSYTSSVSSITSALNATTLVQSQYTGQVNAVMYRLAALQTAVWSLGDPAAWPLANSALRLQDALSLMQAQLLATERQVLTYKTGLDQPLTLLVGTLQTSITDLLTLNPSLASAPYVPANTQVRYYAAGY